jgi:hypothetical protein
VGRFVVERHQAWSRSMTSIIRQRRGCLAEECEGFDSMTAAAGSLVPAEQQRDSMTRCISGAFMCWIAVGMAWKSTSQGK